MVARKTFAERLPGFLRTYKTEKFIRVDVPRVGIFFRTGQFLAFLLVLAQLYLKDGWAMGDTPGGMYNVWSEAGTMLASTIGNPNLAAATEYCSNANFSYNSDVYEYTTPVCETMMPAELTTQDASSIFFTTAILERNTKAWPCTAPDANVSENECVAVSGSSFGFNGQCYCQWSRSLYPLKVEEMELAFEHSYTSPNHGISGSSAEMSCSEMEQSTSNSVLNVFGMGDAPCLGDGEGLWSMVYFPNGTKKKFDTGQTLRLPVREWVTAANTSFDTRNFQIKADPLTGLYPMKRTSGMSVKIEIEYTNVDNVTQRAVPGKTSVHANVRLTAEPGTWTGATVETIWVEYPTQPRSIPQHYHLVERQKQGIKFNFNSYGAIYVLDPFYLLSVVLSGLVLLKFANTATNFYAFNCLGAESVILRNKRIELTSKKSEFAEIGIKAALAAVSYPKFDRFCDGTIEAEDITRAFASVEGVDKETAYMIARNILNDADTEPSLPGEVKGLNYIEFMTCLEGDSIDFDDFLADTKNMYDALIQDQAKEDAEDMAEAGKKPPPKPAGEKSIKQKLKEAKAKAKRLEAERKEKVALMDKLCQANAKAAGKSYDDYMEDTERAEDQALRARCLAAYEEARAEVEKNKPEDSRSKQKEAAVASASGATPPVAGDDLGLSDEAKEERLGQAGTLKVSLQSGSGLKAMDKGGTSDPFVVVKLGKKSKQSKVIEKTLDPTWDETMEFVTKVSLKTVIKNGLVLELKDKDKGMFDGNDAMGAVNVNLTQLDATATMTFNEEVLGGTGLLKFSLEWTPSGTTTPKKAKKKEKEATPGAEDTTQTL